MQAAFEESIREDLDERSNYSAYADWLQDRGDPRGEFIAVQLALDEERPPSERAELQAREKELLDAHEREWLGPLAPFLFPEPSEFHVPTIERRWQWGFLSSLHIESLSIEFAQALATSPVAFFLRELRLFRGRGSEPDTVSVVPRVPCPPGVEDHWELIELIGSACLLNVRLFYLGDPDADEPPERGWTDCWTYANGVERIIEGMPHLEQLHLLCKDYDVEHLFGLPNLDNLRYLRLLHLGARGNSRDWEHDRDCYPLEILASNPSLKKLTHLLFHPHYPDGSGGSDGGHRSFFPLDQVRALLRSPHLVSLTHLQLRLSDMGDDGIREFIDSGILTRLKWLDLRHGCVTDDGARLLAACPDAKHLEHLDLSRNAVTEEGLSALRDAGIPARADSPLTEEEIEQQVYLEEGDFE